MTNSRRWHPSSTRWRSCGPTPSALIEAAREQQAAEAQDAVLEELLGKVELAVPENLSSKA